MKMYNLYHTVIEHLAKHYTLLRLLIISFIKIWSRIFFVQTTKFWFFVWNLHLSFSNKIDKIQTSDNLNIILQKANQRKAR